jgi:hypothetical protein
MYFCYSELNFSELNYFSEGIFWKQTIDEKVGINCLAACLKTPLSSHSRESETPECIEKTGFPPPAGMTLQD